MKLFGKKEPKQKEPACPSRISTSKICVCMTCTNRVNCIMETLSRETGCERFLRYCSCKTPSPTVGNTFPDLVLEEYMDYINRKYLGDYNGQKT